MAAPRKPRESNLVGLLFSDQRSSFVMLMWRIQRHLTNDFSLSENQTYFCGSSDIIFRLCVRIILILTEEKCETYYGLRASWNQWAENGDDERQIHLIEALLILSSPSSFRFHSSCDNE